uniref:Alpha-carbonic anhydrase domain-containing protein n=1 Tax=viral metagenome TaxID=1070528 RepID=A0A6C0KP85_9ZZZZ
MSCPDGTSPIDISLSSITGKCDYKCSYSFNYINSSCMITNRGDYLSILYDNSSSPPVVYNTLNYDVKEIRLYSPSLHSYSGNKTDGEFIIVHNCITGAAPLLVCIPINTNNTTSISSMFFKTAIDTVADSAPADGETTTVSISQFNLNDFVPKKPFFSYTATEPYQPCSTTVDFIVFDPLTISLDITSDSLSKLQSIIANNGYDVKTGPNLFYNEKGPNINNGGEIYIDCQPVGSSENTTEIISNISSNGTSSLKNFFKNPFFIFILFILLFVIIMWGLKLLLNMFNVKTGGAASKTIINNS